MGSLSELAKMIEGSVEIDTEEGPATVLLLDAQAKAFVTGEPIPAFCIISPEDRKAAWARYDATHPKEETMKVEAKELQLRVLKAKRVTGRRDDDGPKRRVALDQALAAAQGRTLDAALLGPNLTPKAIADGVGMLNDGTLNSVSTTKKPAASAPAKPQEKTMTTKAKLKTTTRPAPKPLTAKQRGKSANASTTKAKAADARARKSEPKAKAKANARTPVAQGARADGLRPDSKQAKMLDLALRDEGATEQAICKELGWKKCRVTLKRVAIKVGAKLEGKKNVAGETVWFATMPKA